MSSASPPATISLVIVNKDDRAVAETLRALAVLTGPGGAPPQTIVVDASAARLDDVRAAFPAVTWIAFAPRPGKATTIAEQRNAGVRAAGGSVVVFIDAGCTPDDDWLAGLVAPIADEGEAIVAGGVRSRRGPGLRDEDAHFRGHARYLREAATINLAVARPVFDVVGPFDERFDYGSDVDFSWRAVDAGYRIRSAPTVLVTHDWGGARAQARRSFRYGQARFRLYRKHRARRGRMLRDDPIAVVYPAVLLAAPILALEPWLAVAVLAVPLIKNARHRPFPTVADHLVYGCGFLCEAWRAQSASHG